MDETAFAGITGGVKYFRVCSRSSADVWCTDAWASSPAPVFTDGPLTDPAMVRPAGPNQMNRMQSPGKTSVVAGTTTFIYLFSIYILPNVNLDQWAIWADCNALIILHCGHRQLETSEWLCVSEICCCAHSDGKISLTKIYNQGFTVEFLCPHVDTAFCLAGTPPSLQRWSFFKIKSM